MVAGLERRSLLTRGVIQKMAKIIVNKMPMHSPVIANSLNLSNTLVSAARRLADLTIGFETMVLVSISFIICSESTDTWLSFSSSAISSRCEMSDQCFGSWPPSDASRVDSNVFNLVMFEQPTISSLLDALRCTNTKQKR